VLKERNITLESSNKPYLNLKCDNCDHKFMFVTSYVRIRKDLCPQCFPREISSSKGEKEVSDWVKNQGFTIRTNARNIISPLELDIYIPEKNLAIEYCGLYWHSELIGKDKDYHLNKQLLCNKQGITLITIFEDEWILNPEIVKSRLSNLLGITNNKIYARKCIIKEISSRECNLFLKENHLQGSGRSNIRLGAFYDNKLISVMTFNKSNISRKNTTEWEIDRFCSEKNTSVIGIASKLFKYFIKTYNPPSIITYADRRWSNESFYESIGFKFEKYTTPNYWYFYGVDLKRHHRFSMRKNKNDIQEISEWENRQLQGWNRIWDCGNIKYKWAKN
jgi:hypothetical protein